MSFLRDNVWNEDIASQLASVLADITTADDMRAVLSDLLTNQEIIKLGRRLEAAKMLVAGVAYDEVCIRNAMSSRTLTRINQNLTSGSFGYPLALQKRGLHIGARRVGSSDQSMRAAYEMVSTSDGRHR